MINRIIEFFYGWYVDETKNFYNWIIGFLKTLDRNIGLAGNLQNWTKPLYGDYSYVGRVAGPIFRTARIFFGAALYLLIVIFSLIAYLFWIILPIVIIAMVILNLLVLAASPEPVLALGKEMFNLFIR